jgi:hypothetical protein
MSIGLSFALEDSDDDEARWPETAFVSDLLGSSISAALALLPPLLPPRLALAVAPVLLAPVLDGLLVVVLAMVFPLFCVVKHPSEPEYPLRCSSLSSALANCRNPANCSERAFRR